VSNAAVERPRGHVSSAPHVHNEMPHLQRARDAVWRPLQLLLTPRRSFLRCAVGCMPSLGCSFIQGFEMRGGHCRSEDCRQFAGPPDAQLVCCWRGSPQGYRSQSA